MVLKITKCTDPFHWYSGLVGKVIEYYTIENGNALIRGDLIQRLTSCEKSRGNAGYIFDGDYVLGEMQEEVTEVFVEKEDV